MKKELYKEYLELLKNNFPIVEINGSKNIKIQGEKYWIRKYKLPCLTDALIQTSHMTNVTCKTILELTDALYKADWNYLNSFYSVKLKSQRAIETFIELVKNPSSDIETKFLKELKTVA